MAGSIKPFLDEAGRLSAWPSKRNRASVQTLAMELLASKFEPDKSYTERQVNDVINAWHTFGDHALLRRELIIRGLMAREPDGSSYWKLCR